MKEYNSNDDVFEDKKEVLFVLIAKCAVKGILGKIDSSVIF